VGSLYLIPRARVVGKWTNGIVGIWTPFRSCCWSHFSYELEDMEGQHVIGMWSFRIGSNIWYPMLGLSDVRYGVLFDVIFRALITP